MKEFNAARLFAMTSLLEGRLCQLARDSAPVTIEDVRVFSNYAGIILNYIKEIDAPKSQDNCQHLHRELALVDGLFQANPNTGSRYLPSRDKIVSDAGRIITSLSDELGKIRFVSIPKEKNDLLLKDDLLGLVVAKEFPEAKDDIRDAGTCIALELNQAAIFHLMRVAEHGLRKLGHRLKVKTDKPIEYEVWGNIITAIKVQRLDKWGKPAAKSAKASRKLDYYHDLVLDIKGFKDLWRDPTMHARRKKSPLATAKTLRADPKEIFKLVKDFMQKVVEGAPH